MTRRSPITWVPTAYFAMGLPFVVINMVTVLMFKGLEISDTLITFWTSLILLPWTLKPLWSPFLEIYKTKKFFVVLTQLVTGAAFGLAALALNLPDFFAVALAMLTIVAFSGATHDIVCDGVYMSELSEQEQANYIGWQGAFYNIAKIVVTGGFVYLAGVLIDHYKAVGHTSFEANRLAWMIVLGVLCVTMISLGIYHIFMLPGQTKTQREKKSASEVANELVNVLVEFFKIPHIIYYICFIILYRFAEGFVMKIVPLFLKADRAMGGLGLDEKQIGLFYGTFGAAAFVIGSILAGYFIGHYGLKKTLFTLAVIFNLPFAVYTCLAWFQPESSVLICSGIVLEYFGYGFGFVGLTLFMMQQVAPGKHQMAHYAFASGIMNLGVMLPGMMSGWVCDMLGGYANFFIFVLFATIPALLITWFVPFRIQQS